MMFCFICLFCKFTHLAGSRCYIVINFFLSLHSLYEYALAYVGCTHVICFPFILGVTVYGYGPGPVMDRYPPDPMMDRYGYGYRGSPMPVYFNFF